MKRLRQGLWFSAPVAVTVLSVVSLMAAPAPQAAQGVAPGEVTFTKDVAPILQSKCQSCHRPGFGAPMSLTTYEETRPYARAIKQKVTLREMPPWYIDKGVGIQKFKYDMSLSDAEIATIGRWVDGGAQRGNPADMPPPLKAADASGWVIGTPDLVVSSPVLHVTANQPDWWGELDSVPTGLKEERYIAAMQVREVKVNPAGTGPDPKSRGLFVFHHLSVGVGSEDDDTDVPSRLTAHEVGRNGDTFPPDAGRQLPANSEIGFSTVHVHAIGREVDARVEVAFKFHPRGYKPTAKRVQTIKAANPARYIDIRPGEANQRIEASSVLSQPIKLNSFEPHMHTHGVRMCLEAIYNPSNPAINPIGNPTYAETLSCAGYNHAWVRNYEYDVDAEPLLPAGTLLRVVGWYDNSLTNSRVLDPRNWTGLGSRTVDDMFLSFNQAQLLTEDEFKGEVEERKEKIRLGKADDKGCPQCRWDARAARR